MGRLIDTKTAARFLGIAPATLYDWRCKRKADRPKEIKIGGTLKYDRDDIEEYIQKHKSSV